jgi:hypothetical protein
MHQENVIGDHVNISRPSKKHVYVLAAFSLLIWDQVKSLQDGRENGTAI